MTTGRVLLAAVAALSIGVSSAQAEKIYSPAGTWVTNGGESKYQIDLCGKRGDAICAKMIWADDSALGQRLKQYLGKTDVLEVPRTGAPRFSVTGAYRQCALPPAATRCVGAASAPVPDALADGASRIGAGARGESSADALHTTALLDLLWPSGGEPAMRRSIELLEAANAKR